MRPIRSLPTLAASALYSVCPCNTMYSDRLCLGTTSCYELLILFDAKGGGTITLVEIEGKPDTRWRRYRGQVPSKGGTKRKLAVRIIDISQDSTRPIPGSNLLDIRFGRPNREECQHSRHETDYNRREWCMAIVSPPHGLLDELE